MDAIEMQDTKAMICTLSLLQEHYWWPGMAKQMRQVTKACRCCLQYEGGTPKAPLCPIVATTPLDLLHVDFTSIETMMELDKSPRVANVLVFQDHFTKHVLAYVNPWSNCMKTITKFLYGGYISIFGALARLLSDRGASFTSSIIEELCKILGIQQLQTMPYHPQTNRLVGTSHQTIMHMIGKLGEDKKANWPSHLAEIVHAYNATQSAVTGYSPHYLMFEWWPRLLVDFIFPTFGSNEAPMREASTRNVDVYVASVRDQLRIILQEVQAQSTAEACWQKWYYDRKIGTMNLKPGDLVLVKVQMPGRERGRLRIGGMKRLGRCYNKSWLMCPPMKWQTNTDGHESSTETGFFSSCIRGWHSLVYGQPSYTGQVCQSHPMQDYLFGRWWREDATRETWQGQSPDNLPVKLPWGGKMGSCGLDHGHLLKHPLRMVEDHK